MSHKLLSRPQGKLSRLWDSVDRQKQKLYLMSPTGKTHLTQENNG